MFWPGWTSGINEWHGGTTIRFVDYVVWFAINAVLAEGELNCVRYFGALSCRKILQSLHQGVSVSPKSFSRPPLLEPAVHFHVPKDMSCTPSSQSIECASKIRLLRSVQGCTPDANLDKSNHTSGGAQPHTAPVESGAQKSITWEGCNERRLSIMHCGISKAQWTGQ